LGALMLRKTCAEARNARKERGGAVGADRRGGGPDPAADGEDAALIMQPMPSKSTQTHRSANWLGYLKRTWQRRVWLGHAVAGAWPARPIASRRRLVSAAHGSLAAAVSLQDSASGSVLACSWPRCNIAPIPRCNCLAATPSSHDNDLAATHRPFAGIAATLAP